MILLTVSYTNPDGQFEDEIILQTDDLYYAKNLSRIRQDLPFSSVIDDGGVSVFKCEELRSGVFIKKELIWRSGE